VFEAFAALDERLSAKVRRPRAQHVERDERRACAAGASVAGLEMNAALQVLKAGGLALGVERHDLAVEDDRLFQTLRPRPKRLGDFWELAGFVVAEPRPQADAAAARRDLSDGPDAVVLRFVNQVPVHQRRVGKRREHGVGNRGRCHASIMARRPEIFFGFEPIVEIGAVFAAAFEITLIGAQPDVVLGRVDVRRCG